MVRNLTDDWEWAAPQETSAFISKCDSRGPSGGPASVPLEDGTKARVGHGGTWDGDGAGHPESSTDRGAGSEGECSLGV